jgi:hypothetical protein
MTFQNPLSPGTDRRPLPEVDWPSWQGYSIGHWEDDVFVIETVGTNGRAWLDQPGLPATTSLRMVERFTRTDFGHMSMEFIIEENNIAAEHIIE